MLLQVNFLQALTRADIMKHKNFLLQLKNERSGKKSVWDFFYLCFVFKIFYFKYNCTPFFHWMKVVIELEALNFLTRFYSHLWLLRAYVYSSKKHIVYNFIDYWGSPRSSRPEVFCKKGVRTNYAKFTEKQLWQSPFSNKVPSLRNVNFAKFHQKNTFFNRTTLDDCFC